MGELVGERHQAPRTKTWTEVTDEDLIEAVRRQQEGDRDGVCRGAAMVLFELSQPTAEQWEQHSGEPAPANASLGMGLIPPYETPAASVSARLRKLADVGKLKRVEMVRPRGEPAPPGYVAPKVVVETAGSLLAGDTVIDGVRFGTVRMVKVVEPGRIRIYYKRGPSAVVPMSQPVVRWADRHGEGS